MKPSEAMRAGLRQLSEAQPQMIQIHDDYARKGEGACAAGMAYLGAGVPFDTLVNATLDEETDFPELLEPVLRRDFPEEFAQWRPSVENVSLITVIIALNDKPFEWPIENIIAWVESIGR